MPSSHPQPSVIPPPPSLPQYTYIDASKILSSCYPHPVALESSLPRLPTPQRKPIWANDRRIPYTLTTHIVPAAYWREELATELPQTPNEDGNLSKEERRTLVQNAEMRLRNLRKEAIEATAKLDGKIGGRGHLKVMWLCLNRYVRTSTVEGGYTLFFAHANGLHKEVKFLPLGYFKSFVGIDAKSFRPGNQLWCLYYPLPSRSHKSVRFGLGML
jgi:hypothetical protein